jgi:PAS domain S-box-containing protein
LRRAALFEGDGYFRAVLDGLPTAIYTTDASGRLTYYNEAAAALWGRRPKLGAEWWCGSWELYRPDGSRLPLDQCPMAIAVKEGRAVRGLEAVVRRPDGTRVPVTPFPTPLYDRSGALVGAVNVVVDLTDRQRAHQHEERLAAIIESSDDAIASKDLNGKITSWNGGAERLFGYAAAEIIGQPVAILIPPDRLDEAADVLERIRRGERIDQFETIRRRKDGSLVEISLTVSPIRDTIGRVVGASKIARDITERKRAERHIQMLAREVEHRSKNMLALVQATVRMAQGDTPDALKSAILGRIGALASAHDLLVRSEWVGADIRSLVTEELSPYCREGELRADIRGPSLILKPKSAQSLSLAFHELTTNAVKYGALSAPRGRVQVEWSRDTEGSLVIVWTETNGPTVKPPSRRGFGTRVIEQIFNGRASFGWRPDGLVCELALDPGIET